METRQESGSWWSGIRYFRQQEFACPESGRADVSRELVEMLDRARELAAVPFRITSGYRCAAHNARVGGVPGSSHVRGLAADIAAGSNQMRFKIVRALLEAGCNRVGIGSAFVHADVDGDKPESRMWTY